MHRGFRWFPVLLVVASAGFCPSRADAAPKDAAVTRLANDAINNDYLALNFSAAAKKLQKGVAMCAANACSPQVRARVHRDLGVVLIAGLDRPAEAKKAFVEALRADPRVTLDKDLTTPAIEQAFQAAKRATGPSAAAAGTSDAAAPIDKSDCPPDFPGCTPGRKPKRGRAWGEGCARDNECGDGLACRAGICESGVKGEASEEPSTAGRMCEQSADCGKRGTCNADKVCVDTPRPAKKVWLGIVVEQDFSVVRPISDVCGTPDLNAPAGITCIAEDGGPYEGSPEPADTDLGTGNAIGGGTRLSTTRLLLDFTYLVSSNVSLGVRAGYVLNTPANRSISKFHGEGRIAYWFGSDPFRKQRIRPYLAVLGGMGEEVTKHSVPVYETICTTDAACDTPENRQLGLTPNPTLKVWRHFGGGFAGGAIGVMIPTAENQGLLVEVKGAAFFPLSSIAISPSVGYALGL